MKKSWILSVVCLVFLVSLISFVSADVDVYNYTFETEYGQYEVIKGEVNLSLEDIYLDALVEGSLNQEITLEEFLDNNSIGYSCYTDDCEGSYEKGQQGSDLDLSFSDEGWIGFYIEDDKEVREIEDISFNLSSDFDKSSEMPLQIKFFDSSEWQWDLIGDEYGDKDYGCYSSSSDTTSVSESYFCEQIEINNRKKIRVGADISGSDNKELKMIVLGTGFHCSFLPSAEDGCEIEFTDALDGEHSICLHEEGETNYEIGYDNSENSCGWTGSHIDFGSDSYTESGLDFAIYLQQPKYVDGEIEFNDDEIDFIVDDADSYINNKYNRNCSDGCFLPIYLKGINQNLNINNIELKYRSDLQKSMNNIYVLEKDKPMLKSFNGVLDLSLTGFNVGEKDNSKRFKIEIDNEEIVDEDIEVFPSPIVEAIYPNNPAAGVEVMFYVNVDSDNNITRYEWNFGDNTTMTTSKNSVGHVYEEIGGFDLTVKVIDENGYSSEKTISIIAGNPEEVVELKLNQSRDNINNVKSQIALFPSWYKNKLTKQLDIVNKESGLNTLEKKYENAFEDDDYLKIALGLQDLNIPKNVYVSEVLDSPLIISLDYIQPSIIRDYVGGTGNMEDYKEPINAWAQENVDGDIYIETLSVEFNKGIEDLGYVYRFTLNSDNEAYFVLLNPLESTSFETQDAKKQGDSSIVPFSGEKTIKVFVNEPVDYFISPKLTDLVLEYDIGKCNFNKICEKDLGEDSSNCSDCKNYIRAIIWVLVVILLGLVVYTVLQEWYKRKYEAHLFKDRKQLYNLLMFISNARARGMSDDEIEKLLKSKKWSGEKIAYAMKKSKGQKVGMYELIPIEKVFAWFRKKKAEKLVKNQGQQNRQNINKPGFRRINKW